MTLTLFKTILRDQLRRPWMMLLVILSVALGVAVVVSVDLANASAARAFKLSTDAVVGRATHQIVAGTASRGIDESVYRELRVTQGNRLSAPVVDNYVGAKEMGGQVLHVLGIDFFAEPPFRTFLTANTTQVGLDSFAALFAQPNTGLVSAASAERFNLKPGDKLTLVIDSHEQTITLVGLLRPPNEISARALDGLLLTDISTAQELFGMKGRLSRIDLIATEAEAKAIARKLPTGLRIVPASEQANTVTQLTAAFQLNLTAFSLLALLVGMFLIYNTTLFSVVQRRRVLGILRCIGVTGRQIFAMILLEAAISGIVGSIVGIGLGILLGRLTVALVTQTINDLYFSVTVRGVDVEAASIVKGVLLGILSALVAAALPAAEAANIPAVTVLQRSDLELRLRRALPAVTAFGVVLFAIGALSLLLVNSVTTSFAGIFIGLIGITLGVPLLTVALMRFTTRTLGRTGLLGRMAARTVTQALSRTSVAIAALMIAVSVVIGVTVMIESFRSTVVSWLDQTLTADIYISPSVTGASRSASVDPALLEKIRAVSSSSRVESIRDVDVTSTEFGDVRLVSASTVQNRLLKTNRPGNAFDDWRNGSVFVSEPFANRHNVQVDDHITLLTDHGAQSFEIAAIFFDYSSDQGIVLMSLDVYRKYWDDPNISAIGVYVPPNANVNQIEDAIRATIGNAQVVVQSNKSLRDAALVIFDRTFAITATLRIIAVFVAFIGVLGALMALQLERTRELGTLRATGMTLQQLWRLTLLESGLMGAAAGLLAIPTGLLLSTILIYVINLRSFGWTIFFEPVPEVYVQALAISIIAALLAAVYPMLRLGKMQVADALREE
ncbi:MAG: ABC transporter permease [Chloroflexi bacterium]|nr:ABC transporter permease [Chloroflexota bacterium]